MPIRVLDIDDDDGLRRLVQRGLERDGLVVETAANGASGLDRLGRDDIDVVTLDQIMPGMDGLQTLAAMQTAFKPPPVVFVIVRARLELNESRSSG